MLSVAQEVPTEIGVEVRVRNSSTALTLKVMQSSKHTLATRSKLSKFQHTVVGCLWGGRRRSTPLHHMSPHCHVS